MSLHQLVEQGNLSGVADLLSRGTNANTPSPTTETPLHVACKVGNQSMVQLLLDRGAQPAMVNMSGMTPLHYACRRGNVEIVNSLLSRGSNYSQPDVKGWTPLHYACYHGHAAIVETLLRRGGGASVNDKDDGLRTPLSMACRGGFKPIIITLLNFGAKYNEPDIDGLTPLQHLTLPHKEPPPQDPELQILRELSAQFRTLFRNQNYSDCQFIFENGTAVPAHRAILACRCPKLHQIVASDPAGKIPIYQYGFTQQLFVAMLEFLYSGAIEFENSELELQFAFQLMAKAQEYQIQSLSTYCESTVLHNMDGSTVSLVLDVARQHKVTNVEEYCSWFALKNISQVLQNATPAPQQILQIISQVQLNPTPPSMDSFEKAPVLTKIDPYAGDGYGLGGSAAMKQQKPKPQKPKKPSDGTFSPPGAAPKKQKVAPPTGAYGMPTSTGAPLSSPAGRPKAPMAGSPGVNQPFDAMAGTTLLLVKKVMKDAKASPDCIPFLVPVDIEAFNIPDYRYIITRPIDVGTISKRISAKHYKTVKQWAADMRQVWENARIYNAESSPFNIQAVNMAGWFEQAYASMKQQADLPPNYDPTPPPRTREWYAEQYSAGLKRFQEATGTTLLPASNIPPHAPPQSAYAAPVHAPVQQPRPAQPAPRPMPQAVPPPVARPPQPPAQPKQPPKRKLDQMTPSPYGQPLGANGMGGMTGMHQPQHHMPVPAPQAPVQMPPVAASLTAEEMEDLSAKLNNLDGDQINRVIEILGLSPNANGEYEINITELDTRTLRKLQNFVTQELGGTPAAKRPAF